jgi:hypothetical protein
MCCVLSSVLMAPLGRCQSEVRALLLSRPQDLLRQTQALRMLRTSLSVEPDVVFQSGAPRAHNTRAHTHNTHTQRVISVHVAVRRSGIPSGLPQPTRAACTHMQEIRRRWCASVVLCV